MAELLVRLLGDSRSLEKAYAKAEVASRQFNKTLTGQAKAASGAFLGFSPQQIGAVGLGVALKTSVDAASDLNEQMNRSMVVFGNSGDAVVKWSKTLATGFGVSSREALKAAGDFGTMFQTIGLADKPASDMSRRLVELGADMASFNNADPSDMLDRLRSGLAGEAEPLRRFGVLLSEARVKQEAYRSGLAARGATLTEQQKVQARYNLILKDTAVQQGDALRTGDALAGQQRRLKAQMDNLAASAGNQVVPALTDVTGALNEVIGAMERLNGVPVPKILGGGGSGGLFGMLGGKIKGGLAFQFPFIEPLQNLIKDLNKKPAQGSIGAGLFDPRPFPFGLNFGKVAAQGTFKFGGAKAAEGVSASQRNQFFDQMIGRELVDVQDISTLKGQIARLKEISAQITARIAVTKDITRKLTLVDQVTAIARTIRGDRADIAANVAAAAAKTAAVEKEAAAKLEEAKRAAVEESFGWLDLAISRAATTKTIKDDLAAYADQEAAIRAQIKLQGHTLALETQLFGLQQDRAALVAKHAADVKAAAAARKQFAADAKAKATETRMGWLDFAVDRAEATKTIKDDIKAQQAIVSYLQDRMRSEGRTLELVRGIWDARQKIADLNKKKSGADPLAGLVQVSSRKLTDILAAGTGLSGAGRRVLGANIAGAELRPMHIHLNVDGTELTKVVTRGQARTGNRTANQTSGRRG